MHCEYCDHGFLFQEQQDDSKEFYSERYRQEYSHRSKEASTNAREIFEVYKLYQKARLDIITPLLHPTTRLLEVGASSGQFLWHIKDSIAEVNAIELDRECRLFLEKQLNINADDEYLECSRFAGRIYDLVCAFQVMEHVKDPVQFLETLAEATESNGTIVLEVPNLHDPLLSVWDVPAYRKFYYHSAHLHYFSERSLRKVAQAVGFADNAIEIIYTQDYNILNHLHWIMNNSPQPDCHYGLSEVRLMGYNTHISDWLAQELRELNKCYTNKLAEHGKTSNIIMKIRRG
jgi:2-polyprenyl-3-methyl-5-hydroxy-6-metoxy-1,4-benzoquinol methylase